MIGLKSAAAIVVSASLVAVAAARGTLAPSYLAALGGSSWFLIGLLATLLLGLVGVGWRFGVRSRGAIRFVDKRPTIVDDVELVTATTAAPRKRNLPRELSFIAIAAPSSGIVEHVRAVERMQRSLVLAGLVAVLLGAFSNRAAARIVNAPDEYKPSPSAFCPPNPDADPVQLVMRTARRSPIAFAPVPPAPPPVDQAGCALVKRAYALGYAKSLGSCAPKTVVRDTVHQHGRDRAGVRTPPSRRAVRALRLSPARRGGSARSARRARARRSSIGSSRTRAHFAYARDLLADVGHADHRQPARVASHRVRSAGSASDDAMHERFTGAPRCSTRFADLPLWPRVARR